MSATDRLLLHSSISFARCFDDERNAYADAIAALFPAVTAIVPSLWPLEVTNSLVVGERRGRNTQANTGRWTAFLGSLSIVIDDETTTRVWTDTLNIARTWNLSAYDAAYLELALRLGV